MYALRMFMKDGAPPVRTVTVAAIEQILPTVEALLERHANCERVEVSNRGTLLFEMGRTRATTSA